MSLASRSIKLFFILFFTIGSIISGLLTIFYQKETLNYVDSIVEQESYQIKVQQEQINFALGRAISDLFFIRDQNELRTFLETGNAQSLVNTSKEYLALAEHSNLYDQIRFLDDQGMELARVNHNNGTPAVVRQNQLQSKAGRYYFDECLQLDHGEVYISPFDLNVEQGKIEIPHKPMIRLCTPVVDEAGHKQGVVLLNYLGKILIDATLSSEPLAPGSTMLLNRNGYWLIHPDPSREWGFMLEEMKGNNFASDYPEVWQAITTRGKGRVHLKEGLFTFAEVYPLEKLVTADYSWYLVSMVTEKTIEHHSKILLMQIFFLGAGIFLLAAVGSWVLAYTIAKRRLLQSRLVAMAYFDTLTNLPNRRHFFDRLDEALSYAIRYDKKTALLYIDLDGFKDINDTLGHDAGDSVLQHVADCLKQICRKSDTIARLGGDEFAILIPRYENRRDVSTIAAKIIAVLSRSYVINGQDAKVGASIGIAFAPEDSKSKNELLKMADSAMYYAKGQGKNQFLFYSDTVPDKPST